MKDIKNSPKKDKNKINSKFKIKFVPNTNKDKKSKNNSKEKSKTSLKFEKEKKEILYENNIEDKAQLNDVFTNNNNYKNEKFLVNKEIKLLKTYEKNDSSETELIRLQKKKKVYNTILASEKNENFQKVDSNFVKKNTTIDIKCSRTDDKIGKISEKYRTDSEKNEISKIYELSTNKIMIRSTEEKFFEYSKEGKNKEQKNKESNNIKEYNTQQKEKKEKNIQTNKEIKESEDENKKYTYKNYYNGNNIKKRLMKNNNNNKNNYNKIYIFYFYYFYYFINIQIFSSQFIQCYFRKIEFSSSYINLKINKTGNIKFLSKYYIGGDPDIITINNENYTINDIDTLNNLENNIINITLIWNNSITSTSDMFYECDDIIEIDLSHFDTSNVTYMGYMFSGCTSLTSLNLSNVFRMYIINFFKFI